MKAKLRPLKGKYYGTEIEVDFEDGGDIEVFTLWDTTGFELSEREDGGTIEDSHFESKLTYERAIKLINLINATPFNK